jgi:TPR repeat protein
MIMHKCSMLLASSGIAAVLALSLPLPVDAGFKEAVEAYEAGDYKAALAEWMPLAEANDPAAMRNVGHMYRRGLGAPQDYSQALKWYRRAADLGFGRAQANVASMYLKGEGVPQDYVKAAEWFTKAARNGHVIAQYNIGLMHEFGKGVERSQSKALAWYNLAAKAGHKQALNKLSVMVARNPDLKDPAEDTAATTAAVASAASKSNYPEPEKTVAAPTKQKTAVPAPKVTHAPVPATSAVKTENSAAPKAPVVAASKVTPTPKPAVTVNQEPTKEKWDPFANSANKLPSSDESQTKPIASTGAPTAFNQPKPVTVDAKPQTAPTLAPVTTTRVIVEPPKATSEVVAAKESTVVAPAGAPKLSDHPETKEKSEAAHQEAVGHDKDAGKLEGAHREGSDAAEGEKPHEEDEGSNVGFFAALTSLLAGSEAAEKSDISDNSKNIPKTVAVAPVTPAVTAPKPVAVSAAPAPVMTGSALTVAEQLELAQLSFDLREYQQALGVWANLAQQGNAVAQYELGNMFHEGYAVPVDRVKAHFWWSKAKANGSQKAVSSLGMLEQSLTFLEKKQLQK